MRKFRKALRQCRLQRARVRMHRQRACNAIVVLEGQYRIAPLLPLSLAAFGGLILGRSRARWRPPRGLLSMAWRWGFMLARGVL